MQQIQVRTLYEDKLEQLTNMSDIDPGILVTAIANISFDSKSCHPSIFENINPNVQASPEDIKILENVKNSIIGDRINISSGQFRTIKDEDGKAQLVVAYHPFRNFRPQRDAKPNTNNDTSMYKAFNREGFHFGTDDLDAGVVATHYINDIPFDVFLNRFPYLQSHTLIVPDRKFGDKPQNIDPNNQADISILEAMMKLCQNSDLGDKMRIAYNGQGAHASVNHLHFHGFEINPKCIPPIEEYIQNKGNSHATLDEYIRGAEWFPEKDISEGVPNFIRNIFIRNNFGEPLTYNLYMTPKGVACIPRLHQNTPSYVNTMIESNISSGFAFAELAGVLIAPSEEVFKMNDFELLKKYNLVKDAIQIRTH